MRINLMTTVPASDECGPNALLSKMKDAARWRFLAEHWKSLIGGIPLHRWIDEQSLRRGGVVAALDYAMNHHANGERHIA